MQPPTQGHTPRSELGLKPRKKGPGVCVLHCGPATSKHLLYTKGRTHTTHAPPGGGIRPRCGDDRYEVEAGLGGGLAVTTE